MKLLKHHPILFSPLNNRAHREAETCFVKPRAAGCWMSQAQLLTRSEPSALSTAMCSPSIGPFSLDLSLPQTSFKEVSSFHRLISDLPVFSMLLGFGKNCWWKYSISYSRFYLSYFFYNSRNISLLKNFYDLDKIFAFLYLNL